MAQRMFSARICSVLISLVAMLTAIAPAALHAQDISGDWQGTLHAGQDFRVIVHIEKNVPEKSGTEKSAVDQAGKSGATNKDAWKAVLYSIDQGRTASRSAQ